MQRLPTTVAWIGCILSNSSVDQFRLNLKSQKNQRNELRDGVACSHTVMFVLARFALRYSDGVVW